MTHEALDSLPGSPTGVPSSSGKALASSTALLSRLLGAGEVGMVDVVGAEQRRSAHVRCGCENCQQSSAKHKKSKLNLSTGMKSSVWYCIAFGG